MTGQGDRKMDRIKNANQKQALLDVSRMFKTANGCTVRNLRVERTNKTVIGGKVITTAYWSNIITGQVQVKNQWLPAEWNAQGKHAQEQYNLVEVKPDVTQANLF